MKRKRRDDQMRSIQKIVQVYVRSGDMKWKGKDDQMRVHRTIQ